MDQRERSRAYPPHVGTIGGTIRIGHGLHLYCLNRECHHRATVDMAAVAARYGEDLTVAEFMARAVCSECGSRWPNLDLKVWVVNTPSPVGATRKPEAEGTMADDRATIPRGKYMDRPIDPEAGKLVE